MRAEEIILQAPDGRSVTTLINATPIFSEEGETWAKDPVRKIGRVGLKSHVGDADVWARRQLAVPGSCAGSQRD